MSENAAPQASPATPEQKPVKVPAWWKNTYFWIAAILLVVGIIGMAKGPAAIRDPGQKREDSLLVLLYLGGAVLMLVGGLLSHRLTLREFHERNS